MQLVLDRFGRMVLPKAIRDDLGLQPGDVLDIVESGERVVLQPVREPNSLRVKDGVLVYSAKADGPLREAVDRQREERIAKTSGWRRQT
jgi:AbrB family looped-hinge helix DNA binding protein